MDISTESSSSATFSMSYTLLLVGLIKYSASVVLTVRDTYPGWDSFISPVTREHASF